MQYEDETLQAMALSCIPDDELREKAQQQMHEARSRGEELAAQDDLAKQLLEWFKHKFFTWVGNFCTRLAHSFPSDDAASNARHAQR